MEIKQKGKNRKEKIPMHDGQWEEQWKRIICKTSTFIASWKVRLHRVIISLISSVLLQNNLKLTQDEPKIHPAKWTFVKAKTGLLLKQKLDLQATRKKHLTFVDLGVKLLLLDHLHNHINWYLFFSKLILFTLASQECEIQYLFSNSIFSPTF